MIGATYRLQFREGTSFADAARLAPHLANVGITHLYASPIFTAVEGSTHGYDVTDHTALDPSLGGEAGFEAMAQALAAHGLKLLIDIVPNHMAASPQNRWWRDVLKHGEASPFARHFDIDWSAGKLVLPILGRPYGQALEAGEITKAHHPEWGPVVRVPGHDLPLAPGTEAIGDVHACHEAQHYRLAHWHLGRDGLNYRRFFEITGLAGVRVEDPAVFDDVHALIGKLIADGKVDALRVDHVDGLADPAGYLELLSERYRVPVLVEKILEADELLRPWPVEGTTGYEFIGALAALFCEEKGVKALGSYYSAIDPLGIEERMDAAKRQILTDNLAGELDGLTSLAHGLMANDLSARDHGRASVRDGLIALMCAFPVYRTYVRRTADAADLAVLETARAAAYAELRGRHAIVDDLFALLAAPGSDPKAQEFVRRFQQTTGPLMAKAVEDTLFYRYHRLIGLNEVGGSLEPEGGAQRFFAVARQGGLAATQTHDTKRGEDARARLYALTDLDAAKTFAKLRRTLPGTPSPRLTWMLAQMLFASAPLTPDRAFKDRLREAALKSVREAKEETSWTAANEAFEHDVAASAEAMADAVERLDPLASVWRAGAVISLAQALLKTTVKPAPDVYQGTFGWDFSMVDPDNRRPVDFAGEAALCEAAREASPQDLLANWQDGRVKARVLLEGLAARRERPDLFAAGRLEPLLIDGPLSSTAMAFVRRDGADEALVVVPVRPTKMLGADGLALAGVPEGTIVTDRPLTARMSGRTIEPGAIALAPLLEEFPVLFATSW